MSIISARFKPGNMTFIPRTTTTSPPSTPTVATTSSSPASTPPETPNSESSGLLPLIRQSSSVNDVSSSIIAVLGDQSIRCDKAAQPGGGSVALGRQPNEAVDINSLSITARPPSLAAEHEHSTSINHDISIEDIGSDDGTISKLNALDMKDSISSVSLEAMLQEAAKRQTWLDNNLDHPDRRAEITALVDAYENHDQDVFPLDILITGLQIEDNARARGLFADVYKGVLGEQAVAVKRFQDNLVSPGVNPAKVYNRFRREALVWRQLRHPRVLAFIGVDGHKFTSKHALSMVSPWMTHGTLMEYLGKLAVPSTTHAILIKDMASGLDYLHAQEFIHGDLHGSNVFVDSEERAVIGDFGLTCINDMNHLKTTSINKAGAVRWMSPEIIHQEEEPLPKKTMSADVFAFGRLCLTVYTRRLPFHNLSMDYSVLVRVGFKHEQPPRPSVGDCHGTPMPDDMWNIMDRCWKIDPGQRPQISDIKRELENASFS